MKFVLFNSLGKTQRKKRIAIRLFSIFLQKYNLEPLVFVFFFFCVLAVSVQSLGPAALGSVQTHTVISKIMFSQTVISKVTSQYSL